LAASGAVAVVLAVAFTRVATAASPCAPPLLDPQAVWSPYVATELGQRVHADAVRAIGDAAGRWGIARDHACHAEAAARTASLACLDGVRARIDAVRRSLDAGAAPADAERIAAQLVDASVCARPVTPKLATHLSPAAVGALAALHGPDGEAVPTAAPDD